MLRNKSPDSVRSGIFGCPVLSGQETRMPSPVEPYQFLGLFCRFLAQTGSSILFDLKTYAAKYVQQKRNGFIVQKMK